MKDMIDKSECPYRKGSNAYKHWHEGFNSFARDILDDVQKHYEAGKLAEHDVIMNYIADYHMNKRELERLRDIDKEESIRDRDLKEAAEKK